MSLRWRSRRKHDARVLFLYSLTAKFDKRSGKNRYILRILRVAWWRQDALDGLKQLHRSRALASCGDHWRDVALVEKDTSLLLSSSSSTNDLVVNAEADVRKAVGVAELELDGVGGTCARRERAGDVGIQIVIGLG